MRIKTKVTIGVVFLFAVILAIGGLSSYYLGALSRDSRNILKDNYETLEYTKRILEFSDSLRADSARAMIAIEKNLQLQEMNITEKGEQELTHALRVSFEKLKNAGINDALVVKIRNLCLQIQEINMQSIVRKNKVTEETAGKASTYLILIGTICALAAFTFIVNFPGYVANPIVQLTGSIQSIANKNYEERLHFDRRDEFEELAEAFNQMAEKLDEYEHSNLARVLFEKRRTEILINRMTDPVIGLDENSRIVFINDQALNLLNLSLPEIIDKYAPDIAVNNDLLRNLIRQQSPNEMSSLIKAVVNGKENYFSKELITITYTPTGERDVVRIGQVILLKNITSFKELDLAKTNFIATISHELKTPIASIQMCAKLLGDSRVGILNDEQKNITTTLQDEVTRLSKITNELLDLSQVETGNIRLTMRKADAREIVQLAVDAVRLHAEKKNIRIVVDGENDLGIQADTDKTTWVLVNILTNAIRFSLEDGTVRVNYRTENGMVVFSVEDMGPGIEKKYLDRIFEKFFQVPGTASGTGLGLAISKEFIEAQGGQIAVESAVGKGTVFSFRLIRA